MTRAQSRFANFSRKPTKAEMRSAAVLWAYRCRPEKLAEITAEEFAKRHDMKLAEAATLLADARDMRGVSLKEADARLEQARRGFSL